MIASQVRGGWESGLLPADLAAWKGAARDAASALVRAAPSVCAVLPPELCDAIAVALLRRTGWHSFAAPRARAFLPPADDTFLPADRAIAVASADARLAALSLGASDDVEEAAAAGIDEEWHVTLRRAHAACVAELCAQLAIKRNG